MSEKQKSVKGGMKMLVPTIILGVLAVILIYIGYRNGQGAHIEGMKQGAKMTVQLIPLLFFALVIAAMVPNLLSQELLTKWVGVESGFRGIMIGSIAGGMAPGGPFVSLPIAVGLMRSGAGIGTMVAFLTGWSLLAFSRLPMEFGMLGWKLTLIRLACTFFFPPISGLIAQALFGGVKEF